MRRVDVRVQGDHLHRKGWRGRFLTMYAHRYGSLPEQTERLHVHPWRMAVSFVLRGRLVEQAGLGYDVRGPVSIRFYNAGYSHRVVYASPGTRSLFIGLMRRQTPGPNATERVREGYAHRTEIGVGGAVVE